jgi:hypothetical protein
MKKCTQCKVVGKQIKSGWIFNSYFIKLHDLENDLIVTREVPFEQYVDLDLDEVIVVKRFW